jgi:hypothetical protein
VEEAEAKGFGGLQALCRRQVRGFPAQGCLRLAYAERIDKTNADALATSRRQARRPNNDACSGRRGLSGRSVVVAERSLEGRWAGGRRGCAPVPDDVRMWAGEWVDVYRLVRVRAAPAQAKRLASKRSSEPASSK